MSDDKSEPKDMPPKSNDAPKSADQTDRKPSQDKDGFTFSDWASI